MHEHPNKYTFLSIPILSAANRYIFLFSASLKMGFKGYIHFSLIALNISSFVFLLCSVSAQFVGNIKKLIFLLQKNFAYSKLNIKS